MDAKWRFGATVVIWGLATLMAIIALGNAGLGWIEDWVVAVPLGVALIATLAIWESGRGDNRSSSSSKNQSHTDQKSDSTAYTMVLLMEMMDDDEREEFKSQLKQRILSGESLTDASMVQEMEKRKRG